MSMELSPLYPVRGADRDRWILDRRPERNQVDPLRPYAFLTEEEHSATHEIVPVSTVFLTNRECPWRCVMCDLWRNTLTDPVPSGAIPEQIRYALSELPAARQIKLYNSGSFFDIGAIPLADYPSISTSISSFERIIVESHPSLIGDRCLQFRDLLCGQLEVAIGLETVHPDALERLNKKVTFAQFDEAASLLRAEHIDLRVFLLVQPPFIPEAEALLWAERSLDISFQCGATAVTLIPTRAGNGAMEALQAIGSFAPPRLSTVEAALRYGLCLEKGRVFVDLWDIDLVPSCPQCRSLRVERLRRINLSQAIEPTVGCALCGGSA